MQNDNNEQYSDASVMPVNSYVQDNGLPQSHEQPNMLNTPSNFLYSIWVCCSDCDSCLEAYCCSRCQMSRQCNMMKYGEPEINWPTCIASSLLDYCLSCGIAGCIFVCQTREMMRKRYGLKVNRCDDCWCSLCCSCCVLQQQLLEMTARGDFPGACCYQPQHLPVVINMV